MENNIPEKEVIPIGCDHIAFELKEELKLFLTELGFQPLDLGTYSDKRVDYTVYALSVADKVSKGQYKRGIVICKTGVGVSIVANKFRNIRAGLIRSKEAAELTRQHNDTNILALGAGFNTPEEIKEIIKTWLFTDYEGGRHQRRLDQIRIIEEHITEGRMNKDTNEILSSVMLNDTQGRDVKITASLMCANQLHILDDVRRLSEGGIDMFHIDIIDGNFAQNVSLNVDHIKALRAHTHLPIDVHLMVKDPGPYIQRIADAGANIAIFHTESEVDVNRTLDHIKSLGMKSGLAIEVDTPIERLFPYLNKVDIVMFMAVYTGFSGSQFVPEIINKIKKFNEYVQQNNLSVSIMVDGSVGPRTLPHLYDAGARILVGGTSGLFKPGTFKENIKQMKSFCY